LLEADPTLAPGDGPKTMAKKKTPPHQKKKNFYFDGWLGYKRERNGFPTPRHVSEWETARYRGSYDHGRASPASRPKKPQEIQHTAGGRG